MDPNQTPSTEPVASPAANPVATNPFVTAASPTVIQPSTTEQTTAPTPPTTPSPVLPPQPLYTPPTTPQAVSGGGGSLPPQNNKQALLKKWGPIAGIAALVLGVGGYIFGIYLPNQPDNVWQNGLKNSGKALTSLALNLNDKGQLEKLKKTELVVTGEVKGKDFTASVNANSKLDTSKTSSTGSVAMNGNGANVKLNVDVLSDVPQGKVYPNLYFKISGLKSLGEESLFSGFGAYDDKWISVRSDYLEKMYQSSGTESAPSNKEQVTSGDVAELIKTVSSVSNDYLFTAKPDKAVLQNKEYKGKETVDGVNTFHYVVGVNKDHAIAYCKALTVQVNALPIAKKLQSEAQLKEDNDNADKNCKQSVEDDYKDGETFDAWVNAKYKIMHKVRFYDRDNKQDYVDIGQLYKGGNDLSLFSVFHQDKEKTDVKLVVDLNMKTVTSKGTLTFTSKAEGSEYDGNFSLEVKPYSGDVKVEAPKDAIDIEQLFGSLGGGYDYPAGQSLGVHTQNTALLNTDDLRRQISIGAIQIQLDAYRTKTGYYPTLAQLNDAKWRATNLGELDRSQLKAPNGTTYQLAQSATTTQYGYKPGDCSLKGCKSYLLEALLSNGEKYTKKSTN